MAGASEKIMKVTILRTLRFEHISESKIQNLSQIFGSKGSVAFSLFCSVYKWASLMAQQVKNLAAMQETRET